MEEDEEGLARSLRATREPLQRRETHTQPHTYGERSGAPPGGGVLKLGFLSVDWSKKLSSNKMAPRGVSEALNDPTSTVAYNDRVRTILGCRELMTKKFRSHFYYQSR